MLAYKGRLFCSRVALGVALTVEGVNLVAAVGSQNSEQCMQIGARPPPRSEARPFECA